MHKSKCLLVWRQLMKDDNTHVDSEKSRACHNIILLCLFIIIINIVYVYYIDCSGMCVCLHIFFPWVFMQQTKVKRSDRICRGSNLIWSTRLIYNKETENNNKNKKLKVIVNNKYLLCDGMGWMLHAKTRRR